MGDPSSSHQDNATNTTHNNIMVTTTNGNSKKANEKENEKWNTVKVSACHRFFSSIARRLRLLPRLKKRDDEVRKSLRGVIGIATTGAALLLINEENDKILNKEKSVISTMNEDNSEGLSINEFDFLDCDVNNKTDVGVNVGCSNRLSADACCGVTSSHTHAQNGESLAYDPLDDEVEGLFQNTLNHDG